MLTYSFVGCCGTHILSGFYNKLTDKEMTNMLADNRHMGILLAVLTYEQCEVNEAMLIKHGFVKTGEGYNGNSGHMLYLFVRFQDIRKEQKKATSKKWADN